MRAQTDPGELTTADYWRQMWAQAPPQRGFAYYDVVAQHLPANPKLSFLEVGCGMGGILAEFALRGGYEAHGIDYASEPAHVAAFLQAEGVRVGQIHRGNFLDWAPGRTYDIVGSFGFLEHFERPFDVAELHFKHVTPGGLVVITFPNFARGQRVLHWLFDRANLHRHNTRCMSLEFLRAVAQRNGAELLEASYAGIFDFWYERVPRSRVQEVAMWRTLTIVRRAAELFCRKPSPLLSPYIIGVFRAPSGGKRTSGGSQ
jgi:SAM-dependent methyltransferase